MEVLNIMQGGTKVPWIYLPTISGSKQMLGEHPHLDEDAEIGCFEMKTQKLEELAYL